MKQNRLLLLIFLLFSCGDYAGSTSEVDVDITGTVADSLTGTGVAEVQLYLYSTYQGNLQKSDTTLLDSTKSDATGHYSFDSLNDGIYHIQANFADSLYASRRNIHYQSEPLELDTLKLTGPGTITGTVTFDAENKRGVLVYIPGTSYSAYTDSLGSYTIDKVSADSSYTIVFSHYGYSTVEIHDIAVKSLETKTLQSVTLIPNLYPSGLSTIFDSTSRTVNLQWQPLKREDIMGYLIFRKDSLLTALYPEQLNKTLINDTTYVDTLPETVFNSSDTLTFEYRVKAQTINDYTPFSLPAYVETFIIRDPNDIKSLTMFPLEKEQFSGGETYRLGWEFTGLIDSVRVELTINNGASWSDVSPPIKNRGFTYIGIPNLTIDRQCRFRITSLVDSTLYDMSDYFSIEETETIILKNGDFSAGMKYWFDVPFSESDAEYTITLEEGRLRCHITKTGQYPYYIRLAQLGVPIYEGKKYILTMEAEASHETELWVGLLTTSEPWIEYEIDNLQVTGKKEKLISTFNITSTDLNTALVLDLGSDTGTIWLDNISFEILE